MPQILPFYTENTSTFTLILLLLIFLALIFLIFKLNNSPTCHIEDKRELARKLRAKKLELVRKEKEIKALKQVYILQDNQISALVAKIKKLKTNNTKQP